MDEPRRRDRTIGKEEARGLLERAEYGILSTAGADGLPYGIPVSYCVIGDEIYFHCAVEGASWTTSRKIRRFRFAW